MSKVLVVYYTRTGNTKKVAEEIASRLGADIEEIVDAADRKGLLGYLRSLFDAMVARPVEIRETRDPFPYDVVVVGTPVWVSSISAPVREYLSQKAGAIRHAAFFLTLGGSGAKSVFRQMEELCGTAPVALLSVREIDLEPGRGVPNVEAFAEEVSEWLRSLRRPRPVHTAA